MDFEILIKKMDSEQTNQSNILNQKNNLKERLMIEIKFWIENLKKVGWDVKTLEIMMVENPNDVLEAKGEISKQISNYTKLVQRLERLPWEKNESLAKKLINDLKKPELLKEINNLVPQYMQILANSPRINNVSEFDFIPWMPDNKSRHVIEPKEIPKAEVIIEENDLEPIEKENVAHVLPLKENKISEKIKEIKSTTYKPDLKEWERYSNSLKKILTDLGVTINYELENLESLSELRKYLAKQVGITPRDSRVDRLLRILLRVIPINLPEGLTLLPLSEIIDKLSFCVIKLSEWTSKRLERRHNNPSGKLLDDSKVLGIALEKIPSPGFSIPLTNDHYDLPSINNIEELIKAVNKLENNILLSK